jgi:RNA polymerase-binding transcription factor DksA
MDIVDKAQLDIEALIQAALDNHSGNPVSTSSYCGSCGALIEEARQAFHLSRCLACQIDHESRLLKVTR